MNKLYIILIIILASTFAGFAQDKQSGGNSVENTPIPFTIGDRDRLNRLEVRMDGLEKSLEQRFKKKRLSVCRLYHDIWIYASRWHGKRSPRFLLSLSRLRAS